jgi:hypothetical protein
MDGRILTATEAMMRRLYCLNSDYVSRQCNVKASTVEMEMSNGLIVLKAKFPRSLIEDNIQYNEGELTLEDRRDSDEDLDEQDEDNQDLEDNNEEEGEKTPPEDESVKSTKRALPKRRK